MIRSYTAPAALSLAGAFSARPRTSVPARAGAPFGRDLQRWVTPGRVFAAGAGVYLLLCALAFLVVRPTTLYYFTDYWEHRAIIEEVIRGGTRLGDPIYGEAAPSRQFTPWSLVLGYLARATGADVDTMMAWGAMLVSALFVIGVRDFARGYWGHRWAPTLLLAALTCGWGVLPIIWTGFHPLRSQLHGNYYPASLVFALTLIVWGRVMHLFRAERFGWANALLIGAIVAACFVTHPLNACFLIAGAVALALAERGVPARRRIGAILPVAAGVAVTAWWPWFDPLALAGPGLARKQPTFDDFACFYDPMFVVDLMWPALFALVALRGIVRDARARNELIALAAITTAYVAGGIADVSVVHRFLAFMALMLQILLVTVLLAAIDGRPMGITAEFSRKLWRRLAVGAAALVVVQVAAAADQLGRPWAPFGAPGPLHNVDAEMRQVRATLPANARVFGWNSAALVLPAYGARVVAFPRPMPLSPGDVRRQAAYRRFFTPGVSACERRAIAARWGATHIAWLTTELNGRVARQLRALGRATSPVPGWRIIVAPPPC